MSNWVSDFWDAFEHGQTAFDRAMVKAKALAARRLAGRTEAGAIRNRLPTLGRNTACPCGSGKKFKACCKLNAQA